MANWMENQPLQFSPYRGVDTNLYTQVGYMKQQQYDAGVQKVQGLIDNIAGFDVIRDSDKEYLNSSVNDLTNKINSISGADWSNKNLLNQVSGFAAQISKDKRIQNAVASTERIKALRASQKEVKDKHPENYSAANEWYDNSYIEDYLNSTDPEYSYKGSTQATPYFDWNKVLNERLKELDPTITTYIDSYGNFQYKVDKASTVTADQIKSVVNGTISTDPRISHQIGIDGLYNYKDYDALTLKNKVSSDYDNYINNYQVEIDKQNKEREKYPTDALQSKRIDANIAALSKLKADVEAEKSQKLSMFNGRNPLSAIKQTLFNDNVRNTFIVNYQKENHEIDLKSNENALQAIKLDFDKQKLFLDYIDSGIDPETKMPIVPGSKYYSLANSKSKNGSGTGSIDDGAMQQVTLSPLTAGENTTGEYTGEVHRSRIGELSNNITSAENALRSQYYAMSGLTPSASNNEAFSNWKAEQQRKLDAGERIDNNFLKYKQSIKYANLELGAALEREAQINQEAIDAFPTAGLKPIKITGIKFPGSDKKYNLDLDPSRDSAIIDTIASIDEQINIAASNIEKTLSSQRLTQAVAPKDRETVKLGIKQDARKQATQEVLGRYQGDQNAGFYKQLFGDQYRQVKDKIINPVFDVIGQREKYKKDKYRALGTTWNEQGSTIAEKEKDRYRDIVMLSEQANNPGEDPDLPTKRDQIDPIATYTNSLGQGVIRYRVDGEIRDIAVPSEQNIVGKPDPARNLDRIIRNSPNQITPTTGVGVLASDNGKVRYALGLNQIDKTTYDLYILDGRNKSSVVRSKSGEVDPFKSPLEAVRLVETFSKYTNPYTNKPLTTEEIVRLIESSGTDATLEQILKPQ